MNKSEYSARDWVSSLGMRPHPEGGFFKETYRSGKLIPVSALPAGFTGKRAISTAIFFLLQNRQFSAFHRIRSDEIWHFHCGASVLLHVLKPDGTHAGIELGLNPPASLPQAVIPAGSWFAAEVKGRHGFSLVGCTVAPGFDFADFELGRRNKLTKAYPAHKALIRRLTR